jgi:hypothetical protein
MNLNQSLYINSRRKCHTVSGLPLFDWRRTVVPATLAGRIVMRRYGISAESADVIARLAGLGGEEAR